MPQAPPDTEELLRCSAAGDGDARQQLLARHRRRRQMIAVRLDPRLGPRLDSSAVVQEVLAEAHERLDDYLRRRPLPFYPWLRQSVWQRLVKLHEHHHAQKRRVSREQPDGLALSDESLGALAERLAVSGPSPSDQAVREEQRRGVREALAALPERDREVLVLRYLEQLTPVEIAAALVVSVGAVKTRHTRALLRLQALLSAGEDEQ